MIIQRGVKARYRGRLLSSVYIARIETRTDTFNEHKILSVGLGLALLNAITPLIILSAVLTVQSLVRCTMDRVD